MNSQWRVGIDLGGTKTEVILMDLNRETHFRARIDSPQGDYDATLSAIRELVEAAEIRAGENGLPVGVGIPGSVSGLTGLVKNANSTWLNGQPMAADLTRLLQRPVNLTNDANCLALSESVDGAGQGAHVVFAAILGTGCGAGITVNGQLLSGPNGLAGEWGHNSLPWTPQTELEQRPCFCGRFGCNETFVSGTGLSLTHYLLWNEHLDAKTIVNRALARGFHVHLFSNCMMPHKVADFLAGLPQDKVSLLANVSINKEDSAQQKKRVEYALAALGPRVQPGITVTSPEFEYAYLIELINRYNLRRRIRIGIAQPIVGHDNEYLHPSQYRATGRALAAMALACEPDLLIADEPTTALDVTIQAQILELIRRIKDDFGMSVMMITHDLGVVAEVAEDVVVAYAGKAVEYANVVTIFKQPKHPYTQALYNSIPRITDTRKRRLEVIRGTVPNPLNFPPGCRFHPRCNYAQDFCRTEEPGLEIVGEGHKVRCFKYNAEKRCYFK